MTPWGKGGCPHVLDRWCGSYWNPMVSHEDSNFVQSPADSIIGRGSSLNSFAANKAHDDSLHRPAKHFRLGGVNLLWWMFWLMCWPLTVAFQLHQQPPFSYSSLHIVEPRYQQSPLSLYIYAEHNSFCDQEVGLPLHFREFIHFGEALNPGPTQAVNIEDTEIHSFAGQPGQLVIGNINPTQILGKEDAIHKLGQGVWTCSETSHTRTSHCISLQRFRSYGMNSVWSCNNAPHSPERGLLRGKAAGTCIVSDLPLVESHFGIATEVWNTCRYSEACVRVTPNCSVLVISLYGPTYNGTHQDPAGLLQALCHTAFERALSFRGPVAITGDFNTTKDSIPGWHVMLSKGWCDLHEVSMSRNVHLEEATCKGARHSFLLTNASLAQSLIHCRVTETFDFASHPVLHAAFDLQLVTDTTSQWWLPKTTDDYFLDEELMEHWADIKLMDNKSKIHEALKHQDGETALKYFVDTFEFAACKSCVNHIGELHQLPRACLGRGNGLPFRKRHPSMPLNKRGRSGDIVPTSLQEGVALRRKLKQVRRLQTLQHSVRAFERCNEDAAPLQEHCQNVWNAILRAQGFQHGFPNWLLTNHFGFVPRCCPHFEYISQVLQTLHAEYKQESLRALLAKQKIRRSFIAEDIRKGGARLFNELRGSGTPCLDQVTYVIEAEIVKQPWPKSGRSVLICRDLEKVNKLQVGEEISFQGQTCRLVQVNGLQVVLDSKVRLKNYSDHVLRQKQITSTPSTMHREVAEAWNQYWLRDNPDQVEEWDSCVPFCTGVTDCPSMEFEEFDVERWQHIVKTIPNKSSRGACGFSKRELLHLPRNLLAVLFSMYAAFESGLAWPTRWAVARVVCLKKGIVAKDATDLRPITILSRLYRVWSAYRSSQILHHISNMVPPSIAGTCGKTSSDALVGFTMMAIDQARSDGCSVFGGVLDLKNVTTLFLAFP